MRVDRLPIFCSTPDVQVKIASRVVLGVCLLVAAAGLLHFVNFAYDDAFISFRYAENLVRGHGLVFNPGERVEGFSNPLWTLLLTLPILVGVDRWVLGLFATSKVFGAIACLATVAVVARSARLLASSAAGSSPRSFSWSLAPLLTATSAPLLAWGVSGLETPLVALLIALAVQLELKRLESGKRRAACGALVWFLAAVSRPEPVLLFAITRLFWLILRWRETARPALNGLPAVAGGSPPASPSWRSWSSRVAHALRAEAPGIVLFAIPYTLLLLARRAYYGSFLPNTYYAKMYGDPGLFARGSNYLEFAFDVLNGQTLLIVSLAVLLLARRWSAPLSLLTLLALTQLLVVLREGGDWMPGLRLLVPIVPVCALLVQCVWLGIGEVRLRRWRLPDMVSPALAPPAWVQWWNGLVDRVERAAGSKSAGHALRLGLRVALLSAAVGTIFGSFDAIRVRGLTSGFHKIQIGSFSHFRTARWMKAHLSADSLLAISEAGVIPYYTKMRVLDLFGLVDRHIAHQAGRMHFKFDLAYVLDRKPDYFFLVGSRTPTGQLTFAQEHSRTLVGSELFQQDYLLLHEFPHGFVFARRDTPRE